MKAFYRVQWQGSFYFSSLRKVWDYIKKNDAVEFETYEEFRKSFSGSYSTEDYEIEVSKESMF